MITLTDLQSRVIGVMLEKEITSNCLDIITNIGKHLVLSDIHCAKELVLALYKLFASSD